jgi:Domain of unknown function (DUF4440)
MFGKHMHKKFSPNAFRGRGNAVLMILLGLLIGLFGLVHILGPTRYATGRFVSRSPLSLALGVDRLNAGARLIDLVRQLIEAENEHGERGRGRAEPILAKDFTAITRARGEEQNRDSLLAEIANPKNPNLHRELEEHGYWERSSGDLGVVRSVVATTDRTNLQAKPKRFRNIYVFQRRQDQWRCIAWQVTELK